MALQLRDELTRALLARLSLFAATMDRDAVLAPEAVRQARELMSCVADPARDPQAVGAVAGLYRARSMLLTGEAAAEALAVAEALRGLAGPGGDEEAVDDRPDEPVEETWARLVELDRRAALLEQAAVNSRGDVELLAQAEAAARATVSAAPRALLPQRAAALRRLGSILRLRYEAHGDPAQLDEAIQVLREAEVAHGSGHPDRGALATTLGVALRLRYERTNALGDLEEAGRFGRVAVAAAEDDRRAAPSGPNGAEVDPNWAGCLHNLGIALRLRHERLGEPADLQEAQRLGREAAAASVPGHPGFGMIRLGLGNATTGEERIAAYEQALAGLPPGDPARPRLLGSLADTLTQICVQGGSPAVAARAGALLDEALAAVPDTHADQAQLLYLRGRLLTARLLRTGTTLGGVPTRQLEEALQCHRAAAVHPAATPRVRLWSLTHWANLAMVADDVRQAALAYEDAVALLPVLTPRNLTDTDTEHTLTALSGLACDAAACHVAAGDPERALALLELGRGVLLGRGLQGRDDMSELARQDPHTAERLLALRTALDTPAPATADRLTDGATAADTRHVLAGQWHDLLTEIRTTRPGFRHFLQPPPVSDLLAQADAGPVVVVNVSRFRCDALLLTRGGLRVVPLPELTLGGVRQHVDAFLTALREFTDPERDFLEDPDRQDVLDLVLRRLWDTVAGPVLDALGMDGVSAQPAPQRLWWVPTGPLTLLPLHAAGHHREVGRPVPRTVLDRAVSSYTPTVRALAHTRGRADHFRRRSHEGKGRTRLLRRRAAPSGFLVVSVPDVPGADSLERAAEEGALLARTVTGVQVLGGTDATRGRVLEEIGRHGWLHFCGHGVTEPDSPSRSHLVVHDPADRRLTVADISRLDLPAAELAYLSACGTAGTGAALADEALHLASALQLAGYHHVVGTLWETDDAVALDLAEKTYAALGTPRPVAERSAQALHTAVRAVRDLYRDSPWFWAAHVHVGM
ncbi:CHAT domain-containing tetratricopeptide repeat protein [Streptomyces sp. WM6386]|uniref:CHAT domain-containing tetratricopeptide repeat protein n=1 Tax=Streptomyces sp. WM6386 TaxID=1415558 RepID=UPI000698485B|nr:CHAT domain-containing protein [Streptomyces sp. WM6386]